MNELKEFKKKIKKESIIKTLCISLICTFSILFITASIFWFFAVKNIWLPIILSILVGIVIYPLLYLGISKKANTQLAARIDALGLEERIITMIEFKNDNSYIAKRQREDALDALKNISANLLKILVPISMIICLIITSVFGVGSQVLNVLATTDKIESGSEIFTPIDPAKDNYFEVMITVDGEGTLSFENSHELDEVIFNVKTGEGFLSTVTAEAKENYLFVGWYLGAELISEEIELNLNTVNQDIVIMAAFQEFEEGEDGEEGESGDEGEEGEGQPGEGEGESGDQGDKPSDKPGDGEGSGWEGNNKNNNLVDGETSYDIITGENTNDGKGVAGSYLGALGSK